MEAVIRLEGRRLTLLEFSGTGSKKKFKVNSMVLLS
jgi:hypothetical protein